MSLVPKDDKSRAVAIISSNSTTKKKVKPKVLDEDDYLDKLESIIQRDFFPDIEKLRAQTEYLDAVRENDVAKIRDLQLRYRTSRRTDVAESKESPRASPKYFETPIRATDGDGDGQEDEQPSTSNAFNPDAPDDASSIAASSSKASTKLGVDEFLAKNTSEDNASFEDLMERSEARMRDKYAWMYKAEDEHNRKALEDAAQAAAADEQMLAIAEGGGPRAASLQNWSYQAVNALMFHPDGVELSPEELVKQKQLAEREIRHENTRFVAPPFGDEASMMSMTKAAIHQSVVSKGKVDVFGEDIGFKNPGQQHFGFVATPSPAPGVSESPLMTWGEIEGTPFRLDAGDIAVRSTPGPTFKMPEIPYRDKLAQGLTEEISKRNRDKKQAAINQVATRLTPKFGSTKSVERISNMSPAAQRLATSKLGIRLGTDKALKASYTPSPARSSLDKTPLTRSSVRQAAESTPEASSSIRKRAQDGSQSIGQDESLTDNLLQLKNKKPRASDFF